MSYLLRVQFFQLKDPPVTFPRPQSRPLHRSAADQRTFIREPTVDRARGVMAKPSCTKVCLKRLTLVPYGIYILSAHGASTALSPMNVAGVCRATIV